jgi:hypothetical protein
LSFSYDVGAAIASTSACRISPQKLPNFRTTP